MLRPALIALGLTLATGFASPAAAACYADYKAKQDDPLRLQYGVLQLPDGACADRGAAEREAAERLRRGGWTLLNLVSIFGPEGLEQRKRDAGANFLRY